MKCMVLHLAWAISAALACVSAAHADEGKPSTARLDVLDLYVGARNVGMGATGVSDASQSAAGYYNPASLAWIDGARLTYTFNESYEVLDVTTNSTDARATFGFDLGSGPRLGGVVGYTDLLVEGRLFVGPTLEFYEKLRDYYLTGGLALGVGKDGNQASVGATAKHVTRGADRGSGWLFDVGVSALATAEFDRMFLRPRIGVCVSNMDNGVDLSSGEYDILGTTRFGVALDYGLPPRTIGGQSVPIAVLTMDVDAMDRQEPDLVWALGWEISLLQLLQARAGVQLFEEDDFRINTLGVGGGWDFDRWGIRADYARLMRKFESMFEGDFDDDYFSATLGVRF